MDSVWNLIATLGVAIISLIGIIIQTKSKERQENLKKVLDDFRAESKQDDINLNKKLDLNHRDTLKLWLITEMTKIKDGLYIPNEEQKQLLHEAKKTYNNLNGDSYVDTMFDNLVNAGLIWYNTEKEVDTYDKYSRIYI